MRGIDPDHPDIGPLILIAIIAGLIIFLAFTR